MNHRINIKKCTREAAATEHFIRDSDIHCLQSEIDIEVLACFKFFAQINFSRSSLSSAECRFGYFESIQCERIEKKIYK